MPTIKEIIAVLENDQTRASIAEIDLLDMDSTEEQQRTLLNLLINFSRYRRPLSIKDTLPPEKPHQVKTLKLKNFLITYAEMLEIINSGLEFFWLVDCTISLQENLMGRFVLQQISIQAKTISIEEKFDEKAIYVPGLRPDHAMQHFKLEACTELPESYLSYLKAGLIKAAVVFEKFAKKPRAQNNSPAKKLTRQEGSRNLGKFKISSFASSSTASTSTSVISTENVLTDRLSIPGSPKSFSASFELIDDNLEAAPSTSRFMI